MTLTIVQSLAIGIGAALLHKICEKGADYYFRIILWGKRKYNQVMWTQYACMRYVQKKLRARRAHKQMRVLNDKDSVPVKPEDQQNDNGKLMLKDQQNDKVSRCDIVGASQDQVDFVGASQNQVDVVGAPQDQVDVVGAPQDQVDVVGAPQDQVDLLRLQDFLRQMESLA